MAFGLVTQEAIWLQQLFIKLELLIPGNKFVEILIHKHNKCAEAILLPDSILYSTSIPDPILSLSIDEIQPFLTKKNLSFIKIIRDN